MQQRTAKIAWFVALSVVTTTAQSSSFRYPQARKGDVVDTYFGTTVADPYRWMEDLNSGEVKQWVDAENAVTAKYLDALPLRDQLKSRITELWNYPKVTPPRYEGRHWFYNRNSGLQRQSVVFTRETLNGKETVAIDPNTLSPDGSVALSGFVPAPDAQHFAYGQSEGGSDWATYYVRELATGRQLPDVIKWVKFSGLSWTEDGKGFFYGRYPEPRAGKALEDAVRDKKIFYHLVGTSQSADRLIYERPEEPMLFIDADTDETGRYLFFETNKGTSNKNELFVKDLVNPLSPKLDAPVRPLYPGHTAAYDPLGVVNGTLYLLTDRDAPNKKVVAVPIDRPDPANWKTIVPETKNAIDTAKLVAGKLAVNALVDVASEVTFYNLDGSTSGRIATPGLGTVSGPVGKFSRPEIFYTFTSPLYPVTVFRFDPADGSSAPFEAPKLTFDPTLYTTDRVFAASKDGTRVPLFVTHKKDLKKDGGNPTMLFGYGGFDISEVPRFRPEIPAFLERGGVWATANMRGGGEYGEAWHEAGMFEKKQNVFDDFIAAAEYLVHEHYASPQTLGIMGGSNGGLLVGAVMEQRPDLVAVALPAVGVMDMLRYHKFTGGAAWATEYGSAENEKDFAYLRKYSPLHNVKPRTCYPATLITTADHDDRVVPSHSFKFAATLQAAQGCDRPAMIRIETQGSHGYRPTDKRIAELADEWAFALANMKPGTPATAAR
ncbi:MAG TPA: prolyl oligopeptidase family serine peptidase [Vicinamibacterales bacterium]|nr:prolyl oligopeptidase family serine peptidase [Vicinamibacterales bacterium]